MPKILAVDGPWYLHRIFHTQYETPDKGRQIARRFVAIICKDALAVRASHVLVGFDGARIFRYQLFKDYKANRHHTGESPYDYMDLLMETLNECGIPCVQNHKYEADDILCSIAAKATPKTTVVLGTKDKDSHQCLNHWVMSYDSSFKPIARSFTRESLLQSTGFTPKQYLHFQVLTGDKIDNVPQIMKPSKAKAGLLKFNTISDWAKRDREFNVFLRDNLEALRLNKKLVTLVDDLEILIPAIKWNQDLQLPSSYIAYKQFCNPKSKGLFSLA